MTATAAKTGFGIAFARETSTAGTYAPIAQVADVTPPGKSREVVDGSHHGSTDAYREFISAMRSQKDGSLVLNYEPGGSAWDDLNADFDDDDAHNYKITFPGGTESVIFKAFVTDLTVAAPMADKMTLTVTFKPTGVPTWS